MKNNKVDKEKIIEKWSKLGLLEGLEGNVGMEIGKLFESKLSHQINDINDLNKNENDLDC